LEEREWRDFLIGDVFNFSGTTTTHPSKLLKNGTTPRITCAATNNGLDDFYQNVATERSGVLTVDSATIGTITWQGHDFIATDHVEKLALKNRESLSRHLGIFLKMALQNAIAGKYRYGYKFSQERIKRQSILLPINSEGEPDYEYMAAYAKNIENQKLEQYLDFTQKRLTKNSPPPAKTMPTMGLDWKPFTLDEIFIIKPGIRLTKADMRHGNTPFAGASDSNNGITEFVANSNASLDANVLGVNYNGSVVHNFYHPYKTLFSDDVKRFTFKMVSGNRFLYLFAKTLIFKQREKYAYGYKFNEQRMRRQSILLPVNAAGMPDYPVMEQFMLYLEWQKIHLWLRSKRFELPLPAFA